MYIVFVNDIWKSMEFMLYILHKDFAYIYIYFFFILNTAILLVDRNLNLFFKYILLINCFESKRIWQKAYTDNFTFASTMQLFVRT